MKTTLRQISKVLLFAPAACFLPSPSWSQGVRIQQGLGPPTASLSETFTSLTSVRELADGRIILTDPRERRVVIANMQTQRVAQIGRIGKGPAEYSSAYPVYELSADSSIMVEMSRRWLLFDGDRIVATVASSEPAARQVDIGYGFDNRGQVLIRESSSVQPDSESLVLIQRGTGRRQQVARLQAAPRASSAPGGLTSYEVAVMAPDGWIALMRISPYRVDWRRPDGSWLRGNPISVAPQPFDAQERERYERANAASSQDRSIRWPSHLPPFAINWPPLVSRDGKVVVRKVVSARQPGVRYDVINRRGELERQLVLSANERILGFGNGTVYTVTRDTVDLERVRRYAWR